MIVVLPRLICEKYARRSSCGSCGSNSCQRGDLARSSAKTSSNHRTKSPLASSLLDGSIVVSVEQICHAIRTLVSSAHVVAEGAGGASVAAALTGNAGAGKVVAVVSGGNLDMSVLRTILEGEIPRPGGGH